MNTDNNSSEFDMKKLGSDIQLQTSEEKQNEKNTKCSNSLVVKDNSIMSNVR